MRGSRASGEDPLGTRSRPADLDEPLDATPYPSIDGTPAAAFDAAPLDLKRRTALSILWTIVRTGSDYILSFVVFALLARRLGPAAFGVFALAVAFAEFGRVLPSAGLVNALVQARRVSAALADTVFWSTLVLACGFAAAIALVSRPLAAAVGEPAVGPLLTALGLILPVSAAGATHIALKLRAFGHRSMASRSLVSGVLGGAAALAAAGAGWGPWSLVVQRGVSELAGTAMAWQAYPWMPGRRYSSAELRSIAGFGASMTITQVLFVALVRVQDVIIGRFIGAAAVGVYRTAWRTVELIAQGVIMPFSLVSLPTLARLQDDLPGFRRAYLRIASVSAALAFPAIIGFAVVAPDAITLIFGEQWAESARIARLLGLMAVPFTLNYFAGPALAALGRSDSLARLAALQLALTIGLSLAAAPFGLMAVAGAYVLRAYLTLPVQIWLFRRHSGIGFRALASAVLPAFWMALVMAGALLLLEHFAGSRFEHRVAYLACMLVTGAAVYGLSLLLFARRFVVEQLRDLRSLLPGAAGLTRAGAGAR